MCLVSRRYHHILPGSSTFLLSEALIHADVLLTVRICAQQSLVVHKKPVRCDRLTGANPSAGAARVDTSWESALSTVPTVDINLSTCRPCRLLCRPAHHWCGHDFGADPVFARRGAWNTREAKHAQRHRSPDALTEHRPRLSTSSALLHRETYL